MQALVERDVFKAITVYDYQAVCKKFIPPHQISFGTLLSTVKLFLYEIMHVCNCSVFLIIHLSSSNEIKSHFKHLKGLYNGLRPNLFYQC